MAAYTWTLEKCNSCGRAQRTRGVHKDGTLHCPCGGTFNWVKVSYGKEKYVGAKAGTIEVRK